MPNNIPGQPNQPQRKGSGFTNLSRILEANRANRLGSALQSGIAGGSEQIRQQLGDTRQAFQQQSDAGNLASDQNRQIRENVLNRVGSGQGDVSQSEEDQFKSFRGGVYGGPKELDQSKANMLGTRAQELQQQARNPLSESTLQSIIGGHSNQPYTRGQIGLDRTLLGVINPQQLGQARASVAGLPQNVQREQESARAVGQKRQNEAMQFAKDTENQLKTQTGGVQSAIDTAVSGRNNALNAEIQKYQADPYSYLGTNRQQTFGLDIPSYGGLVNFLNPGDINRNTQANAQQLAQLQALSKLSGTQQDFITDPSKVGLGANQQLSTIDRGLLDRASESQRQAFSQDVAGIADPLRAATQDPGTDYSTLGIQDKLNALHGLASKYGQSPSVTPQIQAMANNPIHGLYGASHDSDTANIINYLNYINSLTKPGAGQQPETGEGSMPWSVGNRAGGVRN